MGITKVTRNYQITLPKDVRRAANVKIGDELVVEDYDGEIRIKKIKNDSFERAFGMFKGMTEDSVDYVNKIREGSEKRRKRLGI